MKLFKTAEFFDDNGHTKKYYLCGIRYLKKRWAAANLRETYLFKFKISGHYLKNDTSKPEKKQIFLNELIKYVSNEQGKKFESDNTKSATIVIPVYNGVQHLENLIPSLVKHTPESVKIIMIDDCSPDEKTVQFLEKLKRNKQFIIKRNKQNMGFVATINYAMSLVKTRYAIWLNTDTVVPECWLERLLSQFNEFDKIATITPFTNSGVCFSFPKFGENNELAMSFEKIDKAFQRVLSDISINDIYSGTGFCMAIDMNCWKEVGELDYNAFGKGYGEENDWCFRAGRKGWKHLIAPNLFVWHRHGGSFLSEEKQKLCDEHQKVLHDRYPEEMGHIVPNFFNDDPWKAYRCIASLLCCNKNTVIVIDLKQENRDKSGAIDYRHNMIKELKNMGYDVILLEYVRYGGNKWNIVPVSVDASIDIPLKSFSDTKLLFDILDIKQVVINNLVCLPNIEQIIDVLCDIKNQYKPKFIYKFHDHLSICPSYFLLNENCVNCENFYNTDKCAKCLLKNPYLTIKRSDINLWRSKWAKLFRYVDEFNFFSEYTLNKVKKVYPIVYGKHTIKEHLPLFSENFTKYKKPTDKQIINVAFCGAFIHEKGADYFVKLADLCREKNLNINFYIIGIDNPTISHKNIKYICGYQRDELGKILTENNIHAVVYSSIGNETFSYLAQELMILNVPFVCFDNGGHSERVKKYNYKLAEIADEVSAESLMVALKKLFKKVYNVSL